MRAFLKYMAGGFNILLLLAVFLSGCAEMDIGGIDIISAAKTIEKVAKSFQDITPDQEYYIGRAVGATIAGQYPIYDNPQTTMYLNLLGQTLAQASDRPETFGFGRGPPPGC